MNKDRSKKYKFLKLGYHFVSYISSKSIVLNDFQIGENSFVLENNFLQPFVVRNVFVEWEPYRS